MEHKHSDSEKIDQLGGTAAVARLFGIAQPSVSKWRKTGIPPARLMYLNVVRPDVFAPVERRPDQEASHA